jgi:hypothetical protein
MIFKRDRSALVEVIGPVLQGWFAQYPEGPAMSRIETIALAQEIADALSRCGQTRGAV